MANLFEKKEKHPSYGMLGFSRRQGSKTNLFGSSIQHQNTISMTLRKGEMHRGLNADWFFGGDVIVEVEMSQAQFAEAITSMNMGSGVPVTIRYQENKGYIERPDFKGKKDMFNDELKEQLANANANTKSLIEEIREMFDTKKSIGKGDREEIIKRLDKIYADINQNVTFIHKQFNEQVDKTITEAKGEIEAFCENKLHSIAYAALNEKQELLGEMSIDAPIPLEMEAEETTTLNIDLK